MKIRLVHPNVELYGSDRSFSQVVRAIERQFTSADISIALPGHGPIEQLLDGPSKIAIEPLWVLRRARLRKLILEESFRLPRAVLRAVSALRQHELTYVNTVVVADYLIASAFSDRKPLIHVREIPTGPALHILRGLLRWSGAPVIFNSEATRDAFRLPRRQFQRVIYNGFSPPKLGPPPGAHGGKLRLLVIGRINNWKGQDLLVEACGRLTPAEQARLEVRIVGSVFAGNEPVLAALESQVRSLSLEDVVRIEPFVDDPSPLYRWADLVVLPSRKPEPFGRVVIEAMAHGRPVIASRHGAPLEVIDDERSGSLSTPNDAADLRRLLAIRIQDRAGLASAGASSRSEFEARFTEQAVQEAFLTALEEAQSTIGRRGIGVGPPINSRAA